MTLVHMPRTAGRALGMALTDADLGKRLDRVRNHERWADLVDKHGPRRLMVGTFRAPADWYAAMAVSSVQCHPGWIAPYQRAARDSSWAALVEALVIPWARGVEQDTGEEPDAEILRAEPCLSLLASNYLRLFMRWESLPLPVAELNERHDELMGLTHLLDMGSMYAGIVAVLDSAGIVHRPLRPFAYREEIEAVSVEDVYAGQIGADVLGLIEERDGWLRRRAEAMIARSTTSAR